MTYLILFVQLNKGHERWKPKVGLAVALAIVLFRPSTLGLSTRPGN